MKLGRIIASAEELITSDDFMLVWTLSKILGQVVLIAHWFACLYWLIGSTEQYFDGRHGDTTWPIKPNRNYIYEADVDE